MTNANFDTLSGAVNALTKQGYNEGFKAELNKIVGVYQGKEYLPKDLKIVSSYRFEGETNPQDETIVFAIEAKDGTRGTLVMSYSSEHNQNVALIKKIPKAEE
jgi:hypothetical protein